MSMPNSILSIPGMVSGLPTQQIIQQLVAARQAEETPLQNQETAINNQIQAWNSITPNLTDFQNSLQTLVNSSTWNTMTANSSNSSAISVTATSGATAGSYTIVSNQLAQGQTDASDSFGSGGSNAYTGASAATFSITQGSNTASITVNPGDSLQTIASAINTNAKQNNLNLSASVFTNANGTSQLTISSTQTGSQSAFTMKDTSGGTFLQNTLFASKNVGNSTGSAIINVTQAAQDAQATVNNVTVTSSTNTFNNAISGLDFTLQQQGATSTVTLTQDTQTVMDAVNGFMKSYNTLVQNLDSASKIDTSGSGNNGPLAGDSTVQSILMNLESTVGNLVGNSGTLQGLGQAGILLNTDGTLAFDTSTTDSSGSTTGLDGQGVFNNLLTTDPSDLQKLFGVVDVDGLSPTTGLGGAVNTLINSLNDPTNGTITNEVSSLNDQTSTINDEITQMNDANTQYQQQLQDQFNAMETQISALKSQQTWLNQFGGSSTSSSSSSSSSSSM